MLREAGCGPDRPLDDDWLFTDPMAIDWPGGGDAEPMPVRAAAAQEAPSRRLLGLFAAALMFAAGTLTGAVVSGDWQARLSFSAMPCPPVLATDSGVTRPVPERKG